MSRQIWQRSDLDMSNGNRNAASWVRLAHEQGWAVGQFNMSNLETLQAIVSAAEKTQAPAFIGVSYGTIRHAGLEYIVSMVQAARSLAQVPVMLHLDHGFDLETVIRCIELGFDSVMIDGSDLPYRENVKLVRSVVEHAHPAGVAVEAQVGDTWQEGSGADDLQDTSPDLARDFVTETGIDYLAVSVGSKPGKVAEQTSLNTSLLEDISRKVEVPLVLHGGSSVSDRSIREAMLLGLAKINIDTAIREAVITALAEFYSVPGFERDPRKAFSQARERAEQTVKDKVELFDSNNKSHSIK